MFSEKDLTQIENLGIDPATVEKQIQFFREGFPFLDIDRAAVEGDGIRVLDSEATAQLAHFYDKAAVHLTIEKFVPASGAATRMFKELYEYAGQGKSSEAVEKVLDGIADFAFYQDLEASGVSMKDPKAVISAIIGTPGLDYGNLPKGLIKFHRYNDGSRTAMEEHLVEVALYGGNPAKIHFTVSPEHREGFEKLAAEKIPAYSAKYGVEYRISFSEQEKSTDTIAVELNNEPFRNDDGSLLFRPAGHGALLTNLDRIDADLIFIKNIDNVVPDHLKKDTVLYKKALAAIALEIQQQVFTYLKSIDSGAITAEKADALKELRQFVENKLCYRFSQGSEVTLEQLRRVLDRPLRVCGMVRNEGEPGGGPFWAKNTKNDTQSLQIAESSQISPEQKPLMQQATHFNPVDLVCAVRDYKGNKFNLKQYFDPSTGFISQKSKDGRDLKAQELPGLWNGAMADWNTIFVEVPISTFAPVKSIVDLLRPQHQ